MAQILDPFRKVRPFVKWDKAIDVDPDDEESYTTQYKEAFLKYVEREYCEKPLRKQASLSHSTSQLRSPSIELEASVHNPYLLSSDNEGYAPPPPTTQRTPDRNDRAACLLTAARM